MGRLYSAGHSIIIPSAEKIKRASYDVVLDANRNLGGINRDWLDCILDMGLA